MTAVAVQQNGGHRPQYHTRQSPHSSNGPSPHQSRPQSFASSSAAQVQRQEPPLQNGTSAVMRPAVSNDPVPALNGNGPSPADINRRQSTSAARLANTTSAQDRRLSLIDRPTSAFGANGESSQDDSDRERSKRRPKPLLRSKSDFGPRGEDVETQSDDEIQDWGARHGFEDHYASEEYVSQLANVSRTFLLYSPEAILYIGNTGALPK
jgi:regulator-associated protein of mTOR